MFECANLSVVCYHLVFFFVLFATTKESEAQQLKSPAIDFKRHTIVQPTVHHGRTKREIKSTRDTAGDHHKEVTVTVDANGEVYHLDLRINEDLIAGDHVISYQKNGKTVLHKPTKEELDICQYSGTVKGKPGSWVAVSTCHGVRGIIHDGKTMKYIEPAGGNDINSHHYMYDHADLITDYHCGYKGGVTNNTGYDELLLKKHQDEKNRARSRVSRYKRQAEDTSVRGPYNASKQSRYVELVLVADYREFLANDASFHTVHRQLKDVANIINSVYAPLNIFIALVGVVVWNERDQIQLLDDGDQTLTNFLQYRKTTLLRDIPNDNAHLLTRQTFKGGVVGKALKGPICTYQFSGGVATNHSEIIGLVATTIAHEMGHNFGMEHDTKEDCTCPDEKCIMSPSSTSVVPTHWSSCSLGSLALAFEKGMDYCLRNKPKRLFGSPTCGNGFVEPGEQCDCGLGEQSPCSACCDPRTCTLRGNATCAVGECCDHTTCRPKRAGTVCRSAERECDLPEYCTGYSEYCPRDVYKMDATACGDGQAYCMRGSCRSHSDQCRLLWGSTGESSDERCYTTTNPKGTKNGNCGYSRTENDFKFIRCAQEDSMCGLLQCRHLNERLEFGMESVAQLSAMFINNNGTIIPCRTAMVDLGLDDVDPGLVPDGARCGENKMCLSQRCVPVEMVRERISKMESSVCPSDCSGHGVCNSNGHCHCEAGFAPPLCALPGAGGSADSGPASDSSLQRNFMVAMYVIFLGILPSILLIMFLMYYSRHNVLMWWKKPRKSYVPRVFQRSPGGGTTSAPKTNFNFKKYTDFTHNTDSFLALLHINRKHNTISKCDDECNKTNENCKKKPTVQSWRTKLLSFSDTGKEIPVKNFKKKINKEDIKVADDATELISKRQDNANKINSPHYENLPIKTKENNNKPVIINTGLASTTNENIGKANIKIINNVDNIDKSYNHNKNLNDAQSIPKVEKALIASNHSINKNVCNINKCPNTKPVVDKNQLVIVNKGLASTTNEKISSHELNTAENDASKVKQPYNRSKTNVNMLQITSKLSNLNKVKKPGSSTTNDIESKTNIKDKTRNKDLENDANVKNLRKKFDQNTPKSATTEPKRNGDKVLNRNKPAVKSNPKV